MLQIGIQKPKIYALAWWATWPISRLLPPNNCYHLWKMDLDSTVPPEHAKWPFKRFSWLEFTSRVDSIKEKSNHLFRVLLSSSIVSAQRVGTWTFISSIPTYLHLIRVWEAILSWQQCQCLYENPIPNNLVKSRILNSLWIANKVKMLKKNITVQIWGL